jgi:hypothetical protein
MGVTMPAIFELLYREYCRARLTEMRKQLLIRGPEILQADSHPADQSSVGSTDAQHETRHDASELNPATKQEDPSSPQQQSRQRQQLGRQH